MLTLTQYHAKALADILVDEGYAAITVNQPKRGLATLGRRNRARVITNAPDAVVQSTLAMLRLGGF